MIEVELSIYPSLYSFIGSSGSAVVGGRCRGRLVGSNVREGGRFPKAP
jgi:hypothetical protein